MWHTNFAKPLKLLDSINSKANLYIYKSNIAGVVKEKYIDNGCTQSMRSLEKGQIFLKH